MIKVKKEADSYILTQDNDIVKISNIAIKLNTTDVVLIGRLFKLKKALYEEPIHSPMFHIYIVSELDDTYQYWHLKDIKKKLFCFNITTTRL